MLSRFDFLTVHSSQLQYIILLIYLFIHLSDFFVIMHTCLKELQQMRVYISAKFVCLLKEQNMHIMRILIYCQFVCILDSKMSKNYEKIIRWFYIKIL